MGLSGEHSRTTINVQTCSCLKWLVNAGSHNTGLTTGLAAAAGAVGGSLLGHHHAQSHQHGYGYGPGFMPGYYGGHHGHHHHHKFKGMCSVMQMWCLQPDCDNQVCELVAASCASVRGGRCACVCVKGGGGRMWAYAGVSTRTINSCPLPLCPS